MRKAYQYRWIKRNPQVEGDDRFPDEQAVRDGLAEMVLAPANLVTGALFSDKMPIYQIGIQSLPGTKFYLNESQDPVMIGSTGIYELDLHEKSTISGLRFDPESVKTIEKALNTGTGYLIVDIVYEEDN